MRLADALVSVGACGGARAWLAARPPVADVREHWDACDRGDWLLWIAARAGVDRRLVVRAACAVARTALVHVPAGEMRPLRCVEVAEAWTRGEATIEQVREARDAAYAADAADAAAAAYAYAYAAAAAYAYAADARSLRESAAIVRGIIPWADVDRALCLAAGGAL